VRALRVGLGAPPERLRDGRGVERRRGGRERGTAPTAVRRDVFRGRVATERLREARGRVDFQRGVRQGTAERVLQPQQQLDALQAAQAEVALQRGLRAHRAHRALAAGLRDQLAHDRQDALLHVRRHRFGHEPVTLAVWRRPGDTPGLRRCAACWRP
jgi:hypothetical protein